MSSFNKTILETHVEYETSEYKQFKIHQLYELLGKLIAEDPTFKDAVLYHEEFGSMTKSRCISVQTRNGETQMILSEY